MQTTTLQQTASPDPAATPQTKMDRPLPRLRQPNRSLTLPELSVERLLDPDHPVRLVWLFCLSLDLAVLYDAIKAVEHHPGRPPADPRLLVSLWLFATFDGVGSARRLAKLCDPTQGSLPYLWLCSGVSLNYHTLSDFRVKHTEVLDHLLTDGLAVMLFEELLDLDETAQDSSRVRASAGAGSFRRRRTLEECQQLAQQRVALLRQQAEADNGTSGTSAQSRAGQLRGGKDRERRVKQALEHLAEVEEQRRQRGRTEEKDRDGPEKARASTTDAEARKMKMADGGFRPAYNVEFNATTAGGVIVGVEVSNQGSDSGRVVAMLDQTEERTGQRPSRHLIDGGFGTLEDIVAAAEKYPETTLYAPVKNAEKKEEAGEDPYQPRKKDKPAVAAWRVRMGTEEAKEIYKRRAATAEWVNAQARNRGFYSVRVRGLAKVKAIALWFALVHNMTRLWALRAAKAEAEAAKAAAGQPSKELAA
jgi:transposase